MFGVFGFILKLGMLHETSRNPIHCIQIEFILIGRFKWHNIYLLFIEMVVTSGYLSYFCLSIISNQSVHSPLTSDINKAFSSTQLPLTGYFLFFGPFSVNHRDGCA